MEHLSKVQQRQIGKVCLKCPMTEIQVTLSQCSLFSSLTKRCQSRCLAPCQTVHLLKILKKIWITLFPVLTVSTMSSLSKGQQVTSLSAWITHCFTPGSCFPDQQHSMQARFVLGPLLERNNWVSLKQNPRVVWCLDWSKAVPIGVMARATPVSLSSSGLQQVPSMTDLLMCCNIVACYMQPTLSAVCWKGINVLQVSHFPSIFKKKW